VDITKIGLPTEIYPRSGQEQIVPAARFQSWRDAEQYLLTLGADAEDLERTFAQLKTTSVAVLTIV
jgi:hypothetical protein